MSCFSKGGASSSCGNVESADLRRNWTGFLKQCVIVIKNTSPGPSFLSKKFCGMEGIWACDTSSELLTNRVCFTCTAAVCHYLLTNTSTQLHKSREANVRYKYRPSV